jgi:hypothetical protein
MFHTAQYLAGKLFPEEIFTCSGRSGIDQYKIGEARLIEWYDQLLTYGFSEWNSSTYIPIDLIGIIAVLLTDRDSDVAQKAEQALQYSLNIIEKHNFKGVVSSTYGRSYTKSLLGARTMGTSFLLWVISGHGFVNQNSWAETLICLFDPDFLSQNEKKKDSLPNLIQERQGQLQVPLTDYITENYKLSSINDFCVYGEGEQEHVNHINIGSDPVVNFWINHPGELIVHGESRPSFWAGNGNIPFQKQIKNLLVIQYRISEKLIGFTHLYAPLFALDEYELNENVFYARSGQAYLFIACSQPLEIIRTGASAYREIRAQGRDTAWVVKCSDQGESGSFENFQRNYAIRNIGFKENQVEIHDFQEGEITIHYEKL